MLVKNIIVYDFDGTLIKGDSIKLYCRWLSCSYFEFLLIYHLWFRFLKLFNSKLDLKHSRVKFFHKRYLKRKYDLKRFNKILENNLFSDSLSILNKDKIDSDVFIVSASFSEIINDFIKETFNVKLISNKIESYTIDSDINFTKKVDALKSSIKSNFKIIKGYGNSPGDYSFMKISINPYLRLKNGKIIKWQT